MFDGRIRRGVDPLLDRLAVGLARLGLNANLVTFSGFLLGMGAWAALALQNYIVALILITANRIADGLDGPLARRLGPTDLGGFLDIVFDFLFYAGVPFFFAIGRPEFAVPAAFLVFSFVGTGSSFLAFAAIAAKRQLTSEQLGKKAIYYLGGLTEGAETTAVFILICLYPGYFDWFAWIFGGLCWLTSVIRIAMGIEAFRSPAQTGSERQHISEGDTNIMQ
jgi:phosphatidylglycerophosphate synthase